MIPSGRFPFATICLFAAVTLPGCDPGYTFKPIDARGHKVELWSETIDGVSIHGGPYENLLGETGALFRVDLANHSDQEVVFLGGELVTKGRALKGTLPGGQRRTLAPGMARQLLVDFDYRDHGGEASVALGQTITLTWRVRIGSEKRAVRVKLNR
jgi:hypothetical protein